jgi:crotonobetainyl-CoA:carnitine CoA-transferase CaiB-like acyl-CoA transferase
VRAARRTGRGGRVLGSLARTASFLQLPDLFWDASGEGPAHLPGTVDFVRCTDGWVAALRPEVTGADGTGGAVTARPGQDCASTLASLRRAGVSCVRAASLEDQLRPASLLRSHGYLKTWLHPVWGEMTSVFARGSSSGFRQRDGWPAPDPGADGEQILASLGFSADQIGAMRGCGALGAPVPLFGAAGPAR